VLLLLDEAPLAFGGRLGQAALLGEEAIVTLGPLAAGGLAATVGSAVALLAAAGLGLAGTAAFAASPGSGTARAPGAGRPANAT